MGCKALKLNGCWRLVVHQPKIAGLGEQGEKSQGGATLLGGFPDL